MFSVLFRLFVVSFIFGLGIVPGFSSTLIKPSGINRISFEDVGLKPLSPWHSLLSDSCMEEETVYRSTIATVARAAARESTELYLVSTVMEGDDKGADAGLPFRAYLLRIQKKLFFCINREQSGGTSADFIVYQSIARRLGYELSRKSQVIIKELEEIPVLQQGTLKKLYRVPSEIMVGTPSNAALVHLFDVPDIGPVYMTNVEKSFLANNPLEFKSEKLNAFMNSCRDGSCFETTVFFLFRKDGTFLLYDIKPPEMSPSLDSAGIPKPLGFKEYTPRTLISCEARSIANATPLSTDFLLQNNIRFFGTLPDTHDSIWIFKPSAPLLKKAYAIVQDAEHYWDAFCGEQTTFSGFNAFTSAVPLLVWKDPFGRRILYKMSELNPPACCEPVFYLYSPTPTTVSVKLQHPDIVRRSIPQLREQWELTIEEGGGMRHGTDKHRIPYVFWEGWVGALPMPQSAFDVPKNELETFFDEKLAFLGLTTQEILDFKTLWLSHCPVAPWYTVHFYQTDFANAYCPISVVPAPQTMLRLYIDIEPCNAPHALPVQILSPPPVRRGLVYVEWGAMVREYSIHSSKDGAKEAR